jgi:homoserine acetyltransferase
MPGLPVGSAVPGHGARRVCARDYQEHVAYFWEPFFLRCDANNLLSQLWTWLHGDISDNPVYSGNFEAALGAIKARTIILPVDNDPLFPAGRQRIRSAAHPGRQVPRHILDLGTYGTDESARHPGDRRYPP